MLQIYLCYFFQLVLIFGPFWVIFGPFWQFWVIFGPIWAILGHFWAIWGNFRSFLGHFLVAERSPCRADYDEEKRLLMIKFRRLLENFLLCWSPPDIVSSFMFLPIVPPTSQPSHFPFFPKAHVLRKQEGRLALY